jgi:DNA-directed RNA polymerase subunit RPC12/RpoP
MSEVGSFFRHCPSCGRRFHIKLVSKELVDMQRETLNTRTVGPSAIGGMAMGRSAFVPVVVLESVPVEVDIETFHYQYKCGHCGHEWTENRIEESRE